jgi:hypothetical protein
MVMPYDVTLLAVYTLTLASVTRLVTGTDTLTERPHAWVVDRLEAVADWSVGYFDVSKWSSGWWTVQVIRAVTSFFSGMISCYWCAPFWLSALMLWGYDLWSHPAVLFVSLALAMRFVAGLLISVSR